jgi:hypothetical protein
VVFKAEPEEAGLEDAPLVPPEPGDELPHAAASNAAATNTIAAGNLFRIDLSLHQQRPTRGTWAARAAGRLETTASLVPAAGPGASGGAARNEGAGWALGGRQDRVQVQEVQQPPHLPGRRQQRQATSRLPRPVSRGDQDTDPGGADEGDAGHVDGQMGRSRR